MKTNKLSFKNFTNLKLTRKQSSVILGGEWPKGEKPVVISPGNGAGPTMVFCGGNDLGEYACFSSQRELDEFLTPHF